MRINASSVVWMEGQAASTKAVAAGTESAAMVVGLRGVVGHRDSAKRDSARNKNKNVFLSCGSSWMSRALSSAAAGICTQLKEVNTPAFKEYASQVRRNAAALADGARQSFSDAVTAFGAFLAADPKPVLD